MAEPATPGVPKVERHLAAIVAADVVGYSRLMERDEAGTLARLKRHRRELIEPMIAEHHGRIVKLMGDGLLCEFASVVEAVACAVAVQNAMAEREPDVPSEDRIRFRIGINLGDIILEGDDIYGDGVNVAARLEELAEPGGICVSAKVHEEVQRKLAIGFHPMGRQRVKNIAQPLEVWQVLPGGASGRAAYQVARRRLRPGPALAATVALALLVALGAGSWWWWQGRSTTGATARASGLALPDKPSLAVLPFAGAGGDERLGRLTDGMIEDITTDLARLRDLLVIASHSAFRYRGEARDTERAARELGVRYVVDGSVRQDGERVQVAARLVDATTSSTVWSERYEQPVDALLAVRSELTAQIATTLAGQGAAIAPAELEALRHRPAPALQAYDFVRLGSAEHEVAGKRANVRARSFFEQATMLSPDFAAAWTGLGRAWLQHALEWADDRAEAFENARKACARALELDPRDAAAHFCLGVHHAETGTFEAARSEFRDALEANPNHADNLAGIADYVAYEGEPELGVQLLEKALRLNPFPPDAYYVAGSTVYFLSGDFRRCVELRTKLSRPEAASDPRRLAQCWAMMGRPEEARSHATKAVSLDPQWTLERVWGRPTGERPPPRPRERNIYVEGTRKAGLPVCAVPAQLEALLKRWPDFKTLPECDTERAKLAAPKT